MRISRKKIVVSTQIKMMTIMAKDDSDYIGIKLILVITKMMRISRQKIVVSTQIKMVMMMMAKDYSDCIGN